MPHVMLKFYERDRIGGFGVAPSYLVEGFLSQDAGWPKANRSLIVREALSLLEQDVTGKDDEGVFHYFVERVARRLGPARPQQ